MARVYISQVIENLKIFWNWLIEPRSFSETQVLRPIELIILVIGGPVLCFLGGQWIGNLLRQPRSEVVAAKPMISAAGAELVFELIRLPRVPDDTFLLGVALTMVLCAVITYKIFHSKIHGWIYYICLKSRGE